jgi:Fe-S oxidoreductase
MATYKAEFMAHYYRGRPRPRAAYSMGHLYRWMPLMRLAPGLVNLAMETPGIGALLKRAAGATPYREFPQLADQTLQDWFRAHAPHRGPPAGRPAVMLWPDTFTNHFDPHIGRAAVDVLENAGYRVVMPHRQVCCGRTLYEHGSLDRAKALLCETIATLRPQIRAGMPIVGLEPSCVSVFRDELANLLPHDADARRLSRQTFLFSEFLSRQDRWPLPRLERKAVMHLHCHHKSVLDAGAPEKLLKAMGVDCTMLDTGCCGVAGGFGYEHYDLSMKIGEQALLPAVRSTSPETLVVADGFSCRSQIAHATRRRAVHTAEVVQMALHAQAAVPASFPERFSRRRPARVTAGEAAVAGLALAGAGAAAVALLRAYRRR